MRILVVGAGAIGGYFGGRLLAAGRDVTFLVRQRRAEALARSGLIIKSKLGDVAIKSPPVVQAQGLTTPFDLILLSCKAFDLEGAMASFAPAVGPQTAILPLLNGMRHLDLLGSRFGAARVLGGQCVIATTLDAEGRVLHLNDIHALSFGERDGTASPRVEAIANALGQSGFDARASTIILQEMWEKWAFIASAAALTGMMRATVGDIVAAEGAWVGKGLIEECSSVAASAGHAPRPEAIARITAMLTASGSPLNASLARDIENGAPIEADQIVGDLVARGEAVLPERALLKVALVNLKAYEARRKREAAARAKAA